MNASMLVNSSRYLRNYDDFNNLYSVCKGAKYIKNIYLKYYDIKKHYFKCLKKYVILKYIQLGPFKNFANKYNILKWNKRFMGHTGYIDNVYNTDLSEPIMIGRDKYKRPFITISYLKNNRVGCTTYFQRYEDYIACWAWGGDTFYGEGSNRVMTSDIPSILYLMDEIEGNNIVLDNNSEYKMLYK